MPSLLLSLRALTAGLGQSETPWHVDWPPFQLLLFAEVK